MWYETSNLIDSLCFHLSKNTANGKRFRVISRWSYINESFELRTSCRHVIHNMTKKSLSRRIPLLYGAYGRFDRLL